ncbi:MAG: hypothetical protein H6721_31455 [Sandaracinus sp.]|nr:hypothetical protein [Sandaracinus sp.]
MSRFTPWIGLLSLWGCVGTLQATPPDAGSTVRTDASIARDGGSDARVVEAVDDAATVAIDADATEVDGGDVLDAGDDFVDCTGVTHPTEGLRFFFDAHEGVTSEADVVSAWVAGDVVARRASGSPRFGPRGLGDHPAIVFDGDDDRLEADVSVDGARALTIALVSASGRRAPGVEWCCRADETGCSGTYHTPMMWHGARDWGGVYVAPVQDEVSVRFGNNVKTYRGGDFYETRVFGASGYGSCAASPERDGYVAWTRPSPLVEVPTMTVAVLDGPAIRLFVDGDEVWGRPMPEGGGVDTRPPLQLGAGAYGRHWRGRLGALVVYERALDDAEREDLERALRCRFEGAFEAG